MKIRRFASLATSVQFTPDQSVGKWCLYEDVEPLLQHIKELEEQLEEVIVWAAQCCTGSKNCRDVKPLLERIKELEEQLEFERSLEDWM